MATIIKSDSGNLAATATAAQPLAFSFGDMSLEADKYVDSVRDQAAEIIADAHQQAEQIRRQAEQGGRQVAEQAVHKILDEKVGQQMQTLLPAIEKLVAQLEDARGTWQEHWQNAAVKLAVAMAERIVRRQLEQHPEIALEIIQEGLEIACGSSEVAVHLNPGDFEALGGQVQQLADSMSQLATAEIVPDEGVTPGGCLLKTRFGEIDQRIETQLARLEAELT